MIFGEGIVVKEKTEIPSMCVILVGHSITCCWPFCFANIHSLSEVTHLCLVVNEWILIQFIWITKLCTVGQISFNYLKPALHCTWASTHSGALTVFLPCRDRWCPVWDVFRLSCVPSYFPEFVFLCAPLCTMRSFFRFNGISFLSQITSVFSLSASRLPHVHTEPGLWGQHVRS